MTAKVTNNQGIATLDVYTSEQITPGDFSVTPLEGMAGNTTFTISFSSWTVPEGSLTYDLTYSREMKTSVRGYDQPGKQGAIPVLLQATQAASSSTSLEFTFPISKYDESLTVELKAYTVKEEIRKAIQITLTHYVDYTSLSDYLMDKKSDVWWIK